jgi:molybdenum cofactor cytidylyltransferase
MLSAIVLAAGLSTRMGPDNKLLLYYKNKTVIETVVETILHAGISDIVVVTGHEAEQVQHALRHLPVQFTFNPHYPEGMTSSIRQGAESATGAGYMICLADMVNITAGEYALLKDAFEARILIDEQCICIPKYHEEKGNPVIFSAYYKAAILNNSEAEGCRNIVQANSKHHHFITMPTPHILQDFDYPHEFSRLDA